MAETGGSDDRTKKESNEENKNDKKNEKPETIKIRERSKDP